MSSILVFQINVSEFLESLEKMLHRYYMHSDLCCTLSLSIVLLVMGGSDFPFFTANMISYWRKYFCILRSIVRVISCFLLYEFNRSIDFVKINIS